MITHAHRLQPAIRVLSTAILVTGLLSGCKPPLQITIEIPAARSALAASAGDHLEPVLLQATDQPAPTSMPQSIVPGEAPPAEEERTFPPATTPPSRVVAEAIELDAPVVEVGWVAGPDGADVQWQTADDAAGFHSGSALPGHRGNTVLSGHHNIAGKVFAHIVELQPGDEIQLQAGDQIYRYAVEDTFIVPERGVPDAQRRQNARWIAPTDDERLTLVTCWPADDNSHRVIVIARPLR